MSETRTTRVGEGEASSAVPQPVRSMTPTLIAWEDVPEGGAVWVRYPGSRWWLGSRSHDSVQTAIGAVRVAEKPLEFARAEQQPGDQAIVPHDCEQWDCDAVCCSRCRAKIDAIREQAEAALTTLRAERDDWKQSFEASNEIVGKLDAQLAALRAGIAALEQAYINTLAMMANTDEMRPRRECIQACLVHLASIRGGQ